MVIWVCHRVLGVDVIGLVIYMTVILGVDVIGLGVVCHRSCGVYECLNRFTSTLGHYRGSLSILHPRLHAFMPGHTINAVTYTLIIYKGLPLSSAGHVPRQKIKHN